MNPARSRPQPPGPAISSASGSASPRVAPAVRASGMCCGGHHYGAGLADLCRSLRGRPPGISGIRAQRSRRDSLARPSTLSATCKSRWKPLSTRPRRDCHRWHRFHCLRPRRAGNDGPRWRLGIRHWRRGLGSLDWTHRGQCCLTHRRSSRRDSLDHAPSGSPLARFF